MPTTTRDRAVESVRTDATASRPFSAPRPTAPRRTRAAALSALALLIASCGGGGGGGGGAAGNVPAPQPITPTPAPPVAPAAIGVRVVDGPVSNALVCLDKNANDACDASEPSARTDAGGLATLNVDTADAGKYPVLAQVGTNAVDSDFGAVPAAYLMKAPADRATLVTPLTTMVQTAIENTGAGTDAAEAIVRQQLGLHGSLLRDYSSRTTVEDVKLFALARMLVLVNQKFTSTWDSAIGATVAGGAPVAAAELQRAAHDRMLENLVWIYKQLGEASVLPALATKAPGPINTALAARVADAWRVAGADAQIAPTLVGIARQLKASAGAVTPGGWFSSVSPSSSQTWSATFLDFTPVPGGAGATAAVEHRLSSRSGVLKAAGPAAPTTVSWDGSAWSRCPINTALPRSAPNAGGFGVLTACNGAWSIVNSRAEIDIGGQRIVDVQQRLAGTPYASWTVDATSAGASVFPQGSKLAYERQTYPASTTSYSPARGNVAVVAAAALASGDATACAAVPAQAPALAWGAEATTLEQVVSSSPGTPCVFAPDTTSGARNEWWDASSVSLGKASADSRQDPAAPGYTYERLLRAAFGPGNAATFYACRQRFGDATARNCDAIGTGTYAIASVGDARVLSFDGFPFDRALAGQLSPSGSLANMPNPVLVERGGKVYFAQGSTPTQISRGWLNTQAANAVLATSGVPPIDPSRPVALTVASYQGDWLFWDASTDYASGPSTTLSITSTVNLGASPASGYSCTSNNAGIPGAAVACTLALDPSTGAATVTLPAGMATLALDVNTGAVSGSLAPATAGPAVTLTGSLK